MMCYDSFMLAKTKQTKKHIHPRSFADLMEMYESNYIRLRLICGDIRHIDSGMILGEKGTIPIELKVLEQSAHTTTFMLNYIFEVEDAIRRPDLVVRIYHDSRQAEVISKQCKLTGTRKQSNDNSIPLDQMLLCRWRLNRFLHKWLGYMRYQKRNYTTLDNF